MGDATQYGDVRIESIQSDSVRIVGETYTTSLPSMDILWITKKSSGSGCAIGAAIGPTAGGLVGYALRPQTETENTLDEVVAGFGDGYAAGILAGAGLLLGAFIGGFVGASGDADQVYILSKSERVRIVVQQILEESSTITVEWGGMDLKFPRCSADIVQREPRIVVSVPVSALR